MINLEIKPRFLQSIFEPYRDKAYKNLIIFLFLWYFVIGSTTPFFTVYMLEKLNLSLTLVIFLIVLSQIVNILFLKIWGSLSDRYSNKSVLSVTCPLFLVCIFAWVYTSLPGVYWLTFPLLIFIHIFMGVSLAGITLSLNNICLKLAPKGRANWYLAVTTLFTSIALGIAPLIGGLLTNLLEDSKFNWTLDWTSLNISGSIQILNLQGLDFLFILALIVGVFALHRLLYVKEDGDVKNEIIRNEFLLETTKSVKNFFKLGKSKVILRPGISFYPWRLKRSLKKEKRKDKK